MPRNTETWKYVVAAGKSIYRRSWRRSLEDLFGCSRGRLRYVADNDDLPDDLIAEVERRLVQAALDKLNAAKSAVIDATYELDELRQITMDRADRRMRQRLANDPTEKAVFRELLMNHTCFFDDAERMEYEKEFS
jgi:hypothetical protein